MEDNNENVENEVNQTSNINQNKPAKTGKAKTIILLVIVLILVPISLFRSSLAEEENYSLEAVLYDTVQYSGGTGTTLTESGAQVSGWQFNTSKYLQINPRVPADGNTYEVSIILPQEMYIVATSLVAPSGYSNVEFTKNSSISVNEGNGTYDLKPYSGTAVYTMNYMGETGTLQLELRYDNVLWDKRANSSITPEGVLPIVVNLIIRNAMPL